MTFTEDHLTALETALANGERIVVLGDKRVEYRSIEELKIAIRHVSRQLAIQAAETGMWPGPPRQVRFNTSKGT